MYQLRDSLCVIRLDSTYGSYDGHSIAGGRELEGGYGDGRHGEQSNRDVATPGGWCCFVADDD